MLAARVEAELDGAAADLGIAAEQQLEADIRAAKHESSHQALHLAGSTAEGAHLTAHLTSMGTLKSKRGSRDLATLSIGLPGEEGGRGRRQKTASWKAAAPMSVRRPRREGSLLASNGFLHDADELTLSPGSSKRRRTTVGRPQNGFAAGVAGELTEPVEVTADVSSLEGLVATLKQQTCGDAAPAERVPLGRLLKSSALSGQRLLVQPPPGQGQAIKGCVVDGGKVACGCEDCSGRVVGLAEFEEHARVPDRLLTERILLADHGVSLKALAEMVNAGYQAAGPEKQPPPPSLPQQCSVCLERGRYLLRCGRCKSKSHASCAGLESTYTGPYTCPSCAVVKAQEARQQAEAAAAMLAERALQVQSPKPGRRGGYGRMNGSLKPQQQGRKSQGSKPQRVHMAAPTAKVGLSQRRMVRNSNKHKRLFDPDEPDGVKDGEKVEYRTAQGEKLLEGVVRVSRDGPCGILCACCNAIISCSQFEAHAGRGSRRAPYDNIFTMAGKSLRRLAAQLPSEMVMQAADAGEEEAVQEDMMGGCVLCEEKNFQREGFSDLTVILCDQCEREFHIGCLRSHMGIDLQELPTGDWFCSKRCQQIYVQLRQLAEEGPLTIDEDYQWQLLHGKNGRHATTWTLKACHDILQESFDPIIDQVSGEDLLWGMVYSEKQGEWDHTGMFSAILRHKKQPVCALVMRTFGDMLAEVPLIATKPEARRKGHARFLMDALSALLAKVGVRTLSLPAAHATVETWTHGFGFKRMAAEDLSRTRESFRLLVFPGTEVLYKLLLPGVELYLPPPKASKPKPPDEALLKRAAQGLAPQGEVVADEGAVQDGSLAAPIAAAGPSFPEQREGDGAVTGLEGVVGQSSVGTGEVGQVGEAAPASEAGLMSRAEGEAHERTELDKLPPLVAPSELPSSA